MLYVITGVRGAGKTTLINSLSRENVVAVLQPSTTRPARFEGEKEYDFVETWDVTRYAWSIRYGKDVYGMRRSEVDRTSHIDAITVFEPTSIEIFNEFRRKEAISSFTIGLDTVNDLTEQHARVAGAQSRLMNDEQFDIARRKVRECDVVLAGDEKEILSRISDIISGNTQR